jgi:hypothetical protein
MEQNSEINEVGILKKYQDKIDYYWKASRDNKNFYKRSRACIIIFGSVVTLMSSLSSASFIQETEGLKIVFSVLTPVLAALLTIIGGFAQNFHWGAAWRDMVINAERLEKAHDLFLATKPEARDNKKELIVMHDLIIKETHNFFQRVLENEIKPKEQEDTEAKSPN